MYDRFDVREYWLVDPGRERITLYRRTGDGSFPRVAELARASDDVLTSPLLPGFAMRLAELFE